MALAIDRKLPHVLFAIKGNIYAVSCSVVQEILILPHVECISGLPPHFRGVVNIRGNVMKVIDLRILMGMASARKEMEDLCELLEKREQDHRNWLGELLASVKEQREFKLTTDPHKCAFGKWYDSFRTDDRLLAAQLKMFDEPHRRIHGLAVHVMELQQRGETDAALALVAEAEARELRELIALFRGTRQLIRERYRDMGIVTRVAGQPTIVNVDAVESIEVLEQHAEGTNLVAAFTDVVSGMAMRKGHAAPVMLIDPERLIK